MNFRIVNEQVRANAIAAIRAVEIDREKLMTVRIEEDKKSRTLRQNAYLWGVVYKHIVDNDPGFFASEKTERLLKTHGLKIVDVVHEFCKSQFLPPLFVPVGDGGVKMGLSTAKLNRSEFNDYVEEIRRWAAFDLQVFIPDPVQADFDDVGRR